MEALLGLAKAIPPDTRLIGCLSIGAVVMELDSVIADLVGRDASWDDADTTSTSDRELLDR